MVDCPNYYVEIIVVNLTQMIIIIKPSYYILLTTIISELTLFKKS